jgi:hypothetical protein
MSWNQCYCALQVLDPLCSHSLRTFICGYCGTAERDLKNMVSSQDSNQISEQAGGVKIELQIPDGKTTCCNRAAGRKQ